MNHGIVVEVRRRDGRGVWSVEEERTRALRLREGERVPNAKLAIHAVLG